MAVAFRLFALLSAVLAVSACQQIRETQYLMEVTVEVTRVVVVTATPDAEQTTVAEVQPTATPTDEPTATMTPTPEPEPDDPEDAIPDPVTESIIVAEQIFEGGRMYYLQPVGQIWVLIDDDESARNGVWAFYEDTWEDGMPESDPGIEPPEGFAQPIRGFGQLWRDNEFVRSSLGWALDNEYGFWTDYTYFFGGEIDADGEFIQGPGRHVFSTRAGRPIELIESDGTWTISEPDNGE
ncbi:MAG: hypothetical protein EA396_14865 [Anaerolineaceae bacterium]|nr:MAG: hypothetical protein EA396_14865 [Anaerolineaceae bacterium]